jgi:hypothetical protein
MVRKRGKSSRVTIKGARGTKGDDKNVAININNNKDQKRKKENISDNRDKNLDLSDNVETQRSKEQRGEQTQMETQKGVEEKVTTSAIATTHSIPEVFDSSKYDAMTQMKESSNVNEKELKEISSNIEKVKPIKPDDHNINKDLSTDIEINPALPSEPSSLSTVNPSIEERAAMRRGSKNEIISNDQPLVDNKNIASRKDEKNEESRKEQQHQEYNSLNILNSSYVNLWRDSVNVWIDMYSESLRNIAKVSEYWLDLFSTPWLGKDKQKDKVKVE